MSIFWATRHGPSRRAGKTITVRFTCIGPGNDTQIRSTKGGLFLGTGGCSPGVIYASWFELTPKRDPHRFTVKVDPRVQWAIEVWAGKHEEKATPPSPTVA